MKIALDCSPDNRLELESVLKSKGFSIDDSAGIRLIESDSGNAEVRIQFGKAGIKELFDFLELFPSVPELISDNGMIIGRRKGSYELIPLAGIYYFEADGNDCYCSTRNDRYEVRKKLYEIETGLSRSGFIRINKSMVVNILMIREIIPWFGGRYLLKWKDRTDETEVSRKYVLEFKKFLGI